MAERVGIDATQSTLSRDMKELRAIKVPDAEKGYVYLLPETLQGEQTSGKVSSSVTDNIRYIEFSGNMIVIRTKAGYAKAVGVMVDNEDYDDVLGTLSGDDTVFVLLAEGVKPLDFLPSFDSIHPNIKTLYNPEGRKRITVPCAAVSSDRGRGGIRPRGQRMCVVPAVFSDPEKKFRKSLAGGRWLLFVGKSRRFRRKTGDFYR